MNVRPIHQSRILLALLAALLIAALLGRGLWAAQQDLHASADVIDPYVKAQQHGHFHDTQLGHFHDDNLQLSDIEHQLLHGVGAFENQLDHPATGFAISKVSEPRQAYLLPDPADPHLSGPYRPPRV